MSHCIEQYYKPEINDHLPLLNRPDVIEELFNVTYEIYQYIVKERNRFKKVGDEWVFNGNTVLKRNICYINRLEIKVVVTKEKVNWDVPIPKIICRDTKLDIAIPYNEKNGISCRQICLKIFNFFFGIWYNKQGFKVLESNHPINIEYSYRNFFEFCLDFPIWKNEIEQNDYKEDDYFKDIIIY